MGNKDNLQNMVQDKAGRCFWGGALLFVLAVLLFSAHCHEYRHWVEDDSFITFRYARNLVEGEGLVFNAGERVEGYSNPAWVLLSAAVIKAGGSPLAAAQLVSFMCGVLVLFLAFRLTLRWFSANTWTAGLASLALAAAPLLPRHAMTGMETVPYTACLLAGVMGFLDRERRGFGGVALVALVLLCLLRPEGPAFALLILLLGRANRVQWGVVVGVIALLTIHRLLYFGQFLPNTFFAKVTGEGRGLVEGVLYTVDFLREAGGGLLAGLFLVGLLSNPRNRRTFGLVAGVLALQVAVVLAAGGDWFHFYRFYTPVYPLLIAGAAAGVGLLHEMITGHMLPLGRRGRSAVVLAFALVLLVGYLNIYKTERAVFRMVMPHVNAGTYLTDAYAHTGDWLAENTPADSKVAVSDIGLVGWHSQRHIVDMFGLTDSHIARSEGRQHFKSDAGYVLSKKPTYIGLVMDAAGGYLRVPDQEMAANPQFEDGYRQIWSYPVGFRDETVQVFQRLD
jgi:arabinofuranosyltransferase